MASDNIELFYTRYQHGLGDMLRSDDVGEFVFGVHLDSWSTEHWAHADRVERLFKSWNVVRHDDHMDWVAFAAVVDRKRIVVGVEAVRELLAETEWPHAYAGQPSDGDAHVAGRAAHLSA